MKKIFTLAAAAFISMYATAQTLNIVTGDVTYAIPASQAGDMVYASGSTLTILSKAYTLTDIDSMYVDNTTVTDNAIDVVYSGTSAKVKVAGNAARYLTIAVSGADVSIEQSSDLATELTYTLSGTSDDGSFYMDGSYKATVALNGLTLTNADGYAINIANGKRIAVSLNDGTTNTLSDGASGSQKACFIVNGHAEFKGGGTLTIYGNAAHAFKGDEYVELKKTVGTITVATAVKDGFNVTQYFEQKGGTINISNVGGDGIQVDADDEYSGYVLLSGGTQNISVTATAAKGLKSEGYITVSDGTYTISTSGGGEYDSDDADTKAASAISSDNNITISGGTLTLTSSGTGGKGLKCDSVLTISGGSITVNTTGAPYTYGTLSSESKGIRAGGNVNISGGTIAVSTSTSGAEGIESKATLTISGGTIEVWAYDDCINSSSDMYITGGEIYVTASNNDGLDANGNLYIQGGTIVAYGAASPESGIDANTEEGYKVYFTGGTLVSVGGSNTTPSASTSTQGYVSYTGSVSNGTTLLLRSSSANILAFTMSRSYTSTGGSRPGMGGSGSTNFVISSPSITAGTSYTLSSGATVSGTDWHGLYTAPTVIATGTTLSTLTAVNYSTSGAR